jgi:2-oxoglutarate ferredoxin oxidoreductase subunit alpha
MVFTRQAKVDKIADYIPEQKLDSGQEKGKLLVLGWGSTYGAVKAPAPNYSRRSSVSHAHIRYIRPFPKTLVTF